MTAESVPGEDRAVDELCTLISHLAGQLVDHPDQIAVSAEREGNAVHVRLAVPEEDMGKVIGREGRIARSMRTLLTIAASRRGLRSSLDIGT
jgi:predicted RNA-binding protein YlqC (UPF0109 family)